MTIAAPLSGLPRQAVPEDIDLLKAEITAMEDALVLRARHTELLAQMEAENIRLEQAAVSAKQILALVSRRRGIPAEVICGPRRLTEVVRARWEVWYLMRLQARPDGSPRWSLPRIGDLTGGYDHTSVINGIRRHEEILAGTLGAGEVRKASRAARWTHPPRQPLPAPLVETGLLEMDAIVAMVAERYGVTIAAITEERHHAYGPALMARYETWYLLRQVYAGEDHRWTQAEIGERIGDYADGPVRRGIARHRQRLEAAERQRMLADG